MVPGRNRSALLSRAARVFQKSESFGTGFQSKRSAQNRSPREFTLTGPPLYDRRLYLKACLLRGARALGVSFNN